MCRGFAFARDALNDMQGEAYRRLLKIGCLLGLPEAHVIFPLTERSFYRLMNGLSTATLCNMTKRTVTACSSPKKTHISHDLITHPH